MENNAVDLTPIFIFSLPRSGSTLLQRILAGHDSITTASEPWILLPLIYSQRDRGIYTEYRQTAAIAAIRDFIGLMPDGVNDYVNELRTFITRLYAKTINGQPKYFVDKTPRYHLIIDDILQIFPNSKFIFLWRNPLAMIASMIEQFWNGQWKLYLSQVDIFDGVLNMVDGFAKYQTQSCSLNFENLLANPNITLEGVFDYLDIPYDFKILELINETDLKGRYGDKLGLVKYESINTEPINKWKQVLQNPVRKQWCKNYLRWIGHERLDLMGYDQESLLADLDQVPATSHYLLSDLLYIFEGYIYRFCEPRIFKDKLKTLPEINLIHTHT